MTLGNGACSFLKKVLVFESYLRCLGWLKFLRNSEVFCRDFSNRVDLSFLMYTLNFGSQVHYLRLSTRHIRTCPFRTSRSRCLNFTFGSFCLSTIDRDSGRVLVLFLEKMKLSLSQHGWLDVELQHFQHRLNDFVVRLAIFVAINT